MIEVRGSIAHILVLRNSRSREGRQVAVEVSRVSQTAALRAFECSIGITAYQQSSRSILVVAHCLLLQHCDHDFVPNRCHGAVEALCVREHTAAVRCPTPIEKSVLSSTEVTVAAALLHEAGALVEALCEAEEVEVPPMALAVGSRLAIGSSKELSSPRRARTLASRTRSEALLACWDER
jgi:hypothetical protein